MNTQESPRQTSMFPEGTLDFFLDELRTSSTSEADKGRRFEKLIKQFLIKEPTFEERFEWVKLWDEWEERTDSDTGIDIVAKLKRETEEGQSEFCAIQCKFYAEDSILNKADVDSFLATVGQKKFTQHILVHTAGGLGNHLIKALEEYDPRITVLDAESLAEAKGISWPLLAHPVEKLENKVFEFSVHPHQKEAIQKVSAAFDGTHNGIGETPAGEAADKGKLIMACGSGKTYTALKIAEKVAGAGGSILYLVPSISLLSQTLKEWADQKSIPHNYVGVCSDASAGKDSEDERVDGLTIPVSTNPKNIKAAFQASKPTDMTVCFSTYQSIAKVYEAQKKGAVPEFDIVFADEAHRTTGLENENAKDTGEKISPFIRIHDSEYIKSKKRLYMSATPRVYASGLKDKALETGYHIFSMDDPETYGEELYYLSFGEAVAEGILSDYRVAIIWVDEDEVKEELPEDIMDMHLESVSKDIDFEDAAKMTGLIKLLADPQSLEEESINVEMGVGDALKSRKDVAVESATKEIRQNLSRAIVFANSIKLSKATKEALPQIHETLKANLRKKHLNNLRDSGKDIGTEEIEEIKKMPLHRLAIEAEHTDGTNRASERRKHLEWLNLEQPDTAKILSNARCLTEGVDVPALDAAIFLSPRNSYVDIIQAVGRVMRKAPGKEFGYIIIPAIIPKPEGEEDTQEYIHKQLDKNKSYQTIWRVLQALRSHDERFEVEIEQLRNPEAKTRKITNLTPTKEGDGVIDIANAGEKEMMAATQIALDIKGKDFLSAINAKIVDKVGDRYYWRNWGKQVGDIAIKLTANIKTAVKKDSKSEKVFNDLLEAIQSDCNPSIDEVDVIDLLAQAIITQPVFDSIFKGEDFVVRNPVFQKVQKATQKLEKLGLDAGTESLAYFYKSVAEKAKVIEGNSLAKQELLKELFEQFFAIAAPDTTKKHGIVYTPPEIVDFMLHSCDWLMQKNCNKKLTDHGVDVLDPFAGTGAFISRLIASPDLISDADVEYKYNKDLYASEIQMLSYLMTSATTEEAVHARIGDDRRRPFAGVVLRDSFLGHKNGKDQGSFKMFDENHARANAQDSKNIEVIIGNPPYSVGQKNANDDNVNDRHQELEDHIASSYIANSVGNPQSSSIYDSYFKAFRWASTRVAQDCGIVNFVSNGGWLESKAANGCRATIAKEFAEIYVVNLRGNARTSGDEWRREGENVFEGGGSRATIAITFLVKNQKAKEAGEPCKIHYKDIGDYKKAREKLGALVEWKSLASIDDWEMIEPDKHNDWLNQRIEYPKNAIPIATKDTKAGKSNEGVFRMFSAGLKTNRDAIAFGSSKNAVIKRAKEAVKIFNRQVDAGGEVPSNAVRKAEVAKFKWHGIVAKKVKTWAKEGKHLSYSKKNIVKVDYRPFFPQFCDFQHTLNSGHYQLKTLFPEPGIDAPPPARNRDNSKGAERSRLGDGEQDSRPQHQGREHSTPGEVQLQRTSQSQQRGKAKDKGTGEWVEKLAIQEGKAEAATSSQDSGIQNLGVGVPMSDPTKHRDFTSTAKAAIPEMQEIAGGGHLLPRFTHAKHRNRSLPERKGRKLGYGRNN